MPRDCIATFNVERLAIIDEDGQADETLLPPLDETELRRLYELLVLSRIFDQRALSLQREGRLGTYPSILGQEATQVGSAFALRGDEWIFPSFRETGAFITLGFPLHLLFRYWGGDERGQAVPGNLNIFPVCVSVGTQIPHAVGAAMGARLKGDKRPVVCYFGDGATSKGDFHEGFNLAGVFRLPVVFICQNNQWAISVPLNRQTGTQTLAQKALAYGFEGVRVDGNDVLAVYLAVKQALTKAEKGDGPTFIECFTYRMSDHTTADDAGRYRSADEVETWRKRDPVARFERFMAGRGLWREADAKEAAAKALEAVDEAVRLAEGAPPPEPAETLAYVYASLTSRQKRQMEEVNRLKAETR